jgi:hypothetical protein
MVSAAGSALISGVLCATSVSSVPLWWIIRQSLTTETQRTQRLHRGIQIRSPPGDQSRAAYRTARGSVGGWHLILIPGDAHSIRSLPLAVLHKMARGLLLL